MGNNFNQLRRKQIKQFLINQNFSTSSNSVNFVITPSNKIINSKKYYVKASIERSPIYDQNIEVIAKNDYKTQKIKNFTISHGNGIVLIEFMIDAKSTYDNIIFELKADNAAYTLKNIDILQVSEIYNVIDSIQDVSAFNQIGVQSIPGLLMCIDGEEIKIGRTGIYEVNYGIDIKFMGFIINEEDKTNFILDYKY